MESPCVKICTYDPGSGLCLGCGRTLDEIGDWFSMTDAERRGMGEAGRKLVQQRFTWDLAAERLAAVYGWLLGGPRPDSVDLPP